MIHEDDEVPDEGRVVTRLQREARRPTTLASAIAGLRCGLIGEMDWLIKGLLPADGVTLLYAPSGAGKSSLARHLALRVAREHSAPVAYLACEDAAGTVRAVAALAVADGAEEAELEIHERLDLSSASSVREFADRVAPQGPVLLVVDTLSVAAAGLDLDRAADAAVAMNRLQEIASLITAPILLLHHTGHDRGAPRGSSVLLDRPDYRLKITGSVAAGELVVNVEKARWTAGCQRFAFSASPIMVEIGEARVETVMIREKAIEESGAEPAAAPPPRLADQLLDLIRSLADQRGGVEYSALLDTVRTAGLVRSGNPDSIRRMVSKHLASLESEHLVRRSGQRIEIIDPDQKSGPVRTKGR